MILIEPLFFIDLKTSSHTIRVVFGSIIEKIYVFTKSDLDVEFKFDKRHLKVNGYGRLNGKGLEDARIIIFFFVSSDICTS